jgi:hypothetical protein
MPTLQSSNPKPEIRRNEENPKSETSGIGTIGPISDFGLWFSFGVLISDLG